MADDRKGDEDQNAISCEMRCDARLTCSLNTEDEATIKVASKKNPNPQTAKPKTRLFKLKDKLPKIKEPGDYERGHVVEGACARRHMLLPHVSCACAD